MILVYLFMGLIGAAAAIFALQNLEPVVVRFLVWRVEGMPLALVILLSAFIGIIFASTSAFAQQWRLRFRLRQLEHQVAQLSAAQAQHSTLHPAPRADTPTPR
ncbi:MAG TPA: LapA family protein [Methylomirabilota bacterium]|nr:LapA family protein [Methylomirabilota bacterium]